jgi:hypothetical protein
VFGTEAEYLALLKTVELVKTNSININIEIIQLLNYLCDNDTSKFSNISMLISDGASYAIKSGEMLKGLIPSLKHIVCICHGLHNLCETIRNDSPQTNELISFLKRLLVKNNSNQLMFKKIVNIKPLAFPIITRWGT